MHILIIGAGLGGLTLANRLQQTRHTVSIYERDASPTSRPQGYGIGLSGDSGQRVLNELGMLDQAKNMGQPLVGFPFLHANGDEIFALRMPPEYALLSISRDDLRQMLLESVGEDAIAWGKTFAGYDEAEGQITAHFADGSAVTGDLLIGCDGLRSNMQKQRDNALLHYLGLLSVGGAVTDSTLAAHPFLQGGAFMTVGDGASVYVQTYTSAGRVLWSYCSHRPEEWGQNLEPVQLKAHAAAQTASWHEPIPMLINQTAVEDMGGPLPLYDRDLSHTHTTARSRAVLLGDAAHPMSPFQGQGANLAVLDALELSNTLADSTAVDWDKLAAFEEKSQQRAHHAVLSSRQAAADFHAEDAAQRIAAWQSGPPA